MIRTSPPSSSSGSSSPRNSHVRASKTTLTTPSDPATPPAQIGQPSDDPLLGVTRGPSDDFELTTVEAGEAAADNRLLQLFDPTRHVELSESGLEVAFDKFNDGSLPTAAIAPLLNHALNFVKAAPAHAPLGFDPAKHVLPAGGANIRGILDDDSLDKAEQIEVYRWAQSQGPAAQVPAVPVAGAPGNISPCTLFTIAGTLCLALTTIVTVVAVVGSGRRGQDCLRLLTSDQADEVLNNVRALSQGVNATLGNVAQWIDIASNITSISLYLDTEGNLVGDFCNAAGRAGEPAFLLLMLFAAMALAS